MDDLPRRTAHLERVRARGLRVGVLTNGDAEHQALKLDLVGLTAAVDVLVSSSTLSASKPDPRAFREACDLLGSASGPDAHGRQLTGRTTCSARRRPDCPPCCSTVTTCTAASAYDA